MIHTFIIFGGKVHTYLLLLFTQSPCQIGSGAERLGSLLVGTERIRQLVLEPNRPLVIRQLLRRCQDLNLQLLQLLALLLVLAILLLLLTQHLLLRFGRRLLRLLLGRRLLLHRCLLLCRSALGRLLRTRGRSAAALPGRSSRLLRTTTSRSGSRIRRPGGQQTHPNPQRKHICVRKDPIGNRTNPLHLRVNPG